MSSSRLPRRAGIIAAGHGERLRSGGHGLKPLVPVAGRTLVERVLESLAEAGPASVVIILNEESVAVRDHVARRAWPFALEWIVETTPSSMHSFLRVVEALASDGSAGPYLISTVDTVAAPGTFAAFASASRALDDEDRSDVVLAVAPVADDEKPLLVRTTPGSCRVSAMGEQALDSPWATAGYYSVRPTILQEAEAARRDGISALRVFLARLLDRGYVVSALPVAGGIDVDRPSDVGAAERYLRQVGA